MLHTIAIHLFFILFPAAPWSANRNVVVVFCYRFPMTFAMDPFDSDSFVGCCFGTPGSSLFFFERCHILFLISSSVLNFFGGMPVEDLQWTVLGLFLGLSFRAPIHSSIALFLATHVATHFSTTRQMPSRFMFRRHGSPTLVLTFQRILSNDCGPFGSRDIFVHHHLTRGGYHPFCPVRNVGANFEMVDESSCVSISSVFGTMGFAANWIPIGSFQCFFRMVFQTHQVLFLYVDPIACKTQTMSSARVRFTVVRKLAVYDWTVSTTKSVVNFAHWRIDIFFALVRFVARYLSTIDVPHPHSSFLISFALGVSSGRSVAPSNASLRHTSTIIAIDPNVSYAIASWNFIV